MYCLPIDSSAPVLPPPRFHCPHPQVTDFGLSKWLEDSQPAGGQQQTSAVALNPRWLAPETMRGARADQTAGASALGAACYGLADVL